MSGGSLRSAVGQGALGPSAVGEGEGAVLGAHVERRGLHDVPREASQCCLLSLSYQEVVHLAHRLPIASAYITVGSLDQIFTRVAGGSIEAVLGSY